MPFNSMKMIGPRLLLLNVLALASAVSLCATSVIAPVFEDLVGNADYVVRATVKSVSSEWREKNGYRNIYTKVELTVSEVITGTPPQPLVLEMLGGVVGDEELRVTGTPKFTVGEESVLFVQANGRQYYPLVGIMYGKYLVKREAQSGREYIARSNGTPLFAEQDVVAALDSHADVPALRGEQQALSPAAFGATIRATHAAIQQRKKLQH